MRMLVPFLVLSGVAGLPAGAQVRSWTVLGETTGQFKQRPVDRSGNRPDPPITIRFKVPGPGVLRVTVGQTPYHAGLSPETGVMDMTRKGDSSMLAYGLFSMSQPRVPQSGAPLVSCSAGAVNRAQDAFVEFRAPVNYGFNTQLGCGVSLKVEFSPGAPKPGENFAPAHLVAAPPAPALGAAPTAKAGPITKRTSYRVGAIVNGQRVGAAQVPWVFDPSGSFEAPGLWKGRWTLQPDGTLRAVMTYNGVTDDLVIRFEGGGFIATKQGQPYRWGQILP